MSWSPICCFARQAQELMSVISFCRGTVSETEYWLWGYWKIWAREMDQSGNSGGGEKGSVSDILKPSTIRICWPVDRELGRKRSQLLFRHSVVSDSATPRKAAWKPSQSISIFQNLLTLMSIDSVMPSKHLILCHSLLLPPSAFPSIKVFSSESALCIRWQKYWSFSFSISPSNVYSGFISFRMDWLDLLPVQGTLKSLQHHSSEASILWHSAFFIVQLSDPYMTTGKTKALTRWTFVGKVMSLLLNMLSGLVIAFLPRSKRL